MRAALLLFLSGLSLSLAQEGDPVITEFLARNERFDRDDFEERSDWIEIHNPGPFRLDLEHWSLTDDPMRPRKWVFPSFTLQAGQYRVVFASGRDNRQPGAPLHTNFRLSGDGEYLALVRPDGSVADDHLFPPQFEDISFGRPDTGRWETVLIAPGAPVRALIPENRRDFTSWRLAEHDTDGWLEGTLPASYGFRTEGGLDLSGMRRVNSSVYLRIPFTTERSGPPASLLLRMRHDDGFVAWINGEEIARSLAPEDLAWDAVATGARRNIEALVPTDFVLPGDAVVPGANLLAIQGLNVTAGNSDLLMDVELRGSWPGAETPSVHHLLPTPGRANRLAVARLLPPPLLSTRDRIFLSSTTLDITRPSGVPGNTTIRYTRDGTLPTPASPEFTLPVRLTESTRITARLFGPGGAASMPAEATYLEIDPDMEEFSSDLPLVILENFRGGRPPQDDFQPGFMTILDRGPDGRSSLTVPHDTATRVGIKVRGSSTAGRPKPSLSIEARDPLGMDRGITPLGLPREADWVLWGPYNFDPSLMHNPFIYELSRRIGRYAPRTRFVEVFLNTGGGAISHRDYHGVYALVEKLERDDDRVALAPLFPEHDRPPEVSGGYLLKIDRADPGDTGFVAGGQTIRYVHPKEEVIELPERDPQRRFLRTFFNDMDRALDSADFRDPETGYARYIDVDAAIDHHLLNVLAFNVDALRLSAYMYLPRDGKLVFGPLWDFDRALGSTDGRDRNPAVWRGSGGTDFFNYPWWNRMFRDRSFFQRYIDRFQQLRRHSFGTDSLAELIDGMADELREASVRELDRWNNLPRRQYGGTWEGEVEYLKTWLGRRIAFMESQFVAPPVLAVDHSTSLVSLAAPQGGQIYYTTDGSDPLGENHQRTRRAGPYTEPVPLPAAHPLIARTYDRNHRALTGSGSPPYTMLWSGPVSSDQVRAPVPVPGDLALGELHYHPSPPTSFERRANRRYDESDFEYLELHNAATGSLDLAGTTVGGDIDLVIPAEGATLLAPGESILLVADRVAFAVRYGNARTPRFEYRGSLDNENGSLRLRNGLGEEILLASWQGDWFPLAAGEGHPLVPARARDSGPTAPEHWTTHAVHGGTPGLVEQVRTGNRGIRISEIASRTGPPLTDFVELLNQAGTPIDVGGWYLTDDHTTPTKYRIPEGTRIDPGGHLLVEAAAFGAHPGFGLDAGGEEIHLFRATDGNVEAHVDGFSFPAALPDESLGLWSDSLDRTHLVPLAEATPGAANAPPRTGPIVLSERGTLPDGDIDYLELVNLSPDEVALEDPGSGSIGWRLRGAVRFTFDPGQRLGPGERLLLLSVDPARQRLPDLPEGLAVLGPFEGTPRGLVLLETPDSGLEGDPVPHIPMDMVLLPPTDETVQRRPESGFGLEPTHWHPAPSTPGLPPRDHRPGIVSLRVDPDAVTLTLHFPLAGSYSLQRTDALTDPWQEWQRLDAAPDDTLTVRDTFPPGAQRFYRVIRAILP